MNGMNVSPARAAICSAIEGHCASMGVPAISMRHSKAMASSCSTTKSGVMPQMCVRNTCIAAATSSCSRLQQCKMPGVVTMDRTAAGRQQREEKFHARQTFLHLALADENVGEGVLRPWVSQLDAERALRPRLGVGVLAAQLAGEGRHGKKIRVVRVHRFKALHMRAKPGPHMLLAEHVIEELRELGGEEIAGPLGGDRLERHYGPQVVVAVPERECAMQRALPPVHRQRFART